MADLIHYGEKTGKHKTYLKKNTLAIVKALIGNAEIKDAGEGAKKWGFNFVVNNNGKTFFLKEKI